MPFLTVVFGLATFASIGLPGFANFASEVMVFFGAFGYEAFGHDKVSLNRFNGHQIATVCALWGVVMSAVYMLRAYRRVFLGGSQSTSIAGETAPVHALTLTDPIGQQRWALILLLLALIAVGVRPGMIVNPIKRIMRTSLTAPVTPSTDAASTVIASPSTTGDAVATKAISPLAVP